MSHSRTSKFAGLFQIIRYNYGQYLAGIVAMLVLLAVARWGLAALPLEDKTAAALRFILVAGAILAAWWIVASLVASWWIYDLSPLRRWDWLYRLASPDGKKWVLAHTGLDECGYIFKRDFPQSDGLILDTFDPKIMTEKSIHRARAQADQAADAQCHFAKWPVEDESMDAVYFVLAAHELRRHNDRIAFFREAWRALKEDGKLVLVEHERDPLNFLAFGPGFLHFWSSPVWDATANQVCLSLKHRQRIAGGFVTVRIYQPKTTP